ncbi:HAD domain-containing protein [Actinokineospora soli]|uniref:HAD domain-containing protein n=1 Tax=Actinokineospora soli TaxID=1048753 RepID=A0ABW2TSP8_9PSEU
MRPIVFLDVDGPLNPFAAKGELPGYVEHSFRLRGWSRRHRLRMRLNPAHGPALLAAAAGADLVWATTWGHQANTMVGPAIGLPALPVVECAQVGSGWKFAAVSRYAGPRPLVWLDDDFDLYPAARDAFLDRRRDAVTALVRVDPSTGITDAHLAAVREALVPHGGG